MRRLYWYDAVILRLVLDDFFCFWVFFVHPTVVSVLLSASVERCFVSRMRDFCIVFNIFLSHIFLFFFSFVSSCPLTPQGKGRTNYRFTYESVG